ncbi:MAG TPA: Dyp-type peroxidase [Frankiaceae bacterium]|nr:Dyp-type peroxidase [Frankiaceae bacterium]
MRVQLDLDDIQAPLLRASRTLAYARYVFLRVLDGAAARGWLAGLLPDVTTARGEATPPWTLNVAFTHAGLRALGLGDAALASFPQEFREGMRRRAGRLGDDTDPATGDPVGWQEPFTRPEDLHVLVLVSAQRAELLAERVGRLEAGLAGGGLAQVGRQDAALLPTGREHFGYADGFSQPDLDGMDGPRTGVGAWRWPRRRPRPIRSGEFVLGYPDEEKVLPRAPAPERLARGGSFLVYRKLYQDVAAFRAMLREAAGGDPDREELIAAKIVGRWRDGTPLVVSPDRPTGSLDDALTVFGYRDDPDGSRCPIGAHVRRANPRDGLPFSGKLVDRHRLVRRGLPYGPPLPAGAPDDGADRGIVFMCFNADIARQFEFVQAQWINDGNAFGLGGERDVIGGSVPPEGGRLTVDGTPPRFVPLRRAVQVRGGEYFFLPGMGGLRLLATLPARSAAVR